MSSYPSQQSQRIFYDVLFDLMSIDAFKKWLFDSETLERELPEGLYLGLLSLSFEERDIRLKLVKLLSNHIEYLREDNEPLMYYLQSIIDKDLFVDVALMCIWEQYECGLDFLGELTNYSLILPINQDAPDDIGR